MGAGRATEACRLNLGHAYGIKIRGRHPSRQALATLAETRAVPILDAPCVSGGSNHNRHPVNTINKMTPASSRYPSAFDTLQASPESRGPAGPLAPMGAIQPGADAIC